MVVKKKDLVHMLPVSLAILSDNWQLPVGEYFYIQKYKVKLKDIHLYCIFDLIKPVFLCTVNHIL